MLDCLTFLNSLVNKMLPKGIIPPYEKAAILFQFFYLVILHIPCSNFLTPICWKHSRETFFSYEWSIAHITIQNLFGTLKAHFRCLQHAMNFNIPTREL